MPENNFHTPLPPKAPAFGAVPPLPQQTTISQQAQTGLNPEVQDIASAFHFIMGNKWMMILVGCIAFAGLLIGVILFGGSGSAPSQKKSGLSARIIPNPDLRENMRICGTVSETYPCLLFIMNHSRNDRRGETFFKEAEQLTGRQEYLIRIENKSYTQQRVPPGYIAQIKVPPLR